MWLVSRAHKSLQRRSRHHVLHEQAISHQLHHLRQNKVVCPFGRAYCMIAAVRQLRTPPAGRGSEEPRLSFFEITVSRL